MMWDIQSRSPVSIFRNAGEGLRLAAYLPGARQVITVSQKDKTIRIWDAATGNEFSALRRGPRRRALRGRPQS